jgi:hypothetical protein
MKSSSPRLISPPRVHAKKYILRLEETTKLLSKRCDNIQKGGNQNPYIEEEQTTQWPKEREQKDKQRSTKHTHKTKDRVAQTPDILTRESNRMPMCKFAQLYACHELFLKQSFILLYVYTVYVQM